MKEGNLIRKPSRNQWEELYKAAIEFKKLSPWNWMWDTDIFGIQNPGTKEIGYCCVLGRRGEYFALVVYLGTEGLSGYLQVQQGLIDMKEVDALHAKKCLSVSFEDRRYLSKDDLALIKDLGLVFKGRDAWPQFRSYQPGYHPWYLTAKEAEYALLCLKQAKDIALQYKENPKMFIPPQPNHYFVRVPKGDGGKLTWVDVWLKPIPFQKMVVVKETLDENCLKKIEKIATQKDMIWEIDFFYVPAYVAEKNKRPYYPLVVLWVDRYSYFILNVHITTQQEYRMAFTKEFLNAIENNKIKPHQIWVRKEELFIHLEPLAQRFGIQLRLVKRLKGIEEARKSMVDFLLRGQKGEDIPVE